LENHARVPGLRFVNVIWDAWKPFSFEERHDIIVDAYKQVEGEEAAAEIVVATGATSLEALPMHLLPYKVEAMRRPNDKHSVEAYRQAAAAEVANTLLGNQASDLRYARLEDAERARKRLKKALPNSTWVVVREEPVES
jgi:hypothetical protein